MIVKIERKTNLICDKDEKTYKDNNGFYYFECDEIEYWCSSMKDARDRNFDGCMWIVGEDHENRDQLLTNTLFLFSNERSKIIKIITTSSCYILNNNGKTIDKL